MKSIKLGSAAVNTTKPFIIAMPTVVRPAKVRNIALDLRAVEKHNPNTGICITDEKLEAMPENIKDKLASMESANLISIETLFSPEEYFRINSVADLIADLFNSSIASDASALSTIDADFSVASTVSFVASDGYIHRENKRIDFPVRWEIVGPTDTETFGDVTVTNSGVPAVIDSTIVTDISLDKSDPVYNISITQPTDAPYSFDLRVTLDMSEAELYAESDSAESTMENDAIVSGWKASYTFHITIAKGS